MTLESVYNAVLAILTKAGRMTVGLECWKMSCLMALNG